MIAIYNFSLQRRIRLGQWLSLIFFVYLLAGSCKQNEIGVAIAWKDKQAVGIAIPKHLLGDELNGLPTGLQVRLKGNTTAMLGNYTNVDEHTLFTPLIPLSPGAEYEVLYINKLIGIVKVPAADAALAAYVVDIFPATDTVPMNLLKIYVQFSAPMRQGEALQHIYLLDGNNDTVPNVFLDLQPELWNEQRTILTVWLDPGRIKRDLVPNRQMGNPLQPGKRYTVTIAANWKDVQGLPLRQSFTKKWVACRRDSTSSQPNQWLLKLPKANTKEDLGVNFGESLDYFLLSETITITDKKGNAIIGKGNVLSNGTGYTFRPQKPWQPGHYYLHIASYLEDLAGNNLNRLFDRDITVQKAKPDEDFFEIEFVIEK